MDVVIALGQGSTWDNTELRYALRSLVKWGNDIRDVYLVGERPKWIRNVYWIPAIDRDGIQFKEQNIAEKILLACKNKNLSSDFLFLNDDHYMLYPFPPLPYYYQYPLERSIVNRSAHDTYYHSLVNTLNALQRKGKPTLNFDIHAPIIYNKEKFKQVMNSYDWSEHYGYVIKSLYCNTLQIAGTLDTDLKITSCHSCKDLETITKGRKFFSLGHGSECINTSTFLQYLYPHKSKYEP